MQYTELEITYLDGTVENVLTDQRDGREFAMWANRRGIVAPPGRNLGETMPVVFLRVCAWSAHQRNTGVKVDQEKWDDTVHQVLFVGEVPADPTQPAAPDTSSDSSPPASE
jgi:hypothetical protein